MQQEAEVSAWLWRLPLASLLWVSTNLALIILTQVRRAITRKTIASVSFGGVTLDVIHLRDLWVYVTGWSVLVSAALGLLVILLSVGLRLAGRVNFGQPSVRRALWLAGADVALPFALALAVLVYFRINPPKLMF